jgi:UTP:GlnB (protein PII) uridylyltransferase
MHPMTDFIASMPAAYARAFVGAAWAEHAGIIARRGTKLAHAELCRNGDGPLVCVVADDRPGLLALVTDALLAHGLAVQGARAFCRQRPDGRTEAVDFWELQPTRANQNLALDNGELAAFVQTLSELIAEDILATARGNAASLPSARRTRAFFDLQALRKNEYVLHVEAPDADGLLHAIASTLHAHGVRITACQIDTEGGVARDRFDLSSPEKPLTAVELCDIQLAVLDALPR